MSQPLSSIESSKRHDQLSRKMGAVSLTLLGVSYVISGDFAGWNPGLQSGSYAFYIGFCIVASFYLSLGLLMSELSAALPAAGGGYTFARCAMGKLGGFITGIIVLLEYVLTAAAIGSYITVYFNELIGKTIPLWAFLLVTFCLCTAIHIWGVGEAIKLLYVSTGLAVIGLLTFFIGAGREITAANLSGGPAPSFTDVLSSIPYAMWFFLAIEGVPLAAEEVVSPQKNVPRGLLSTWLCLFVFGGLTCIITNGKLGYAVASAAGSPLVEATLSRGTHTALSRMINIVGLCGLLSSFFAVIYGYSRLTFALSRAAFIPTILSKVNKRGSPWLAILIPSIVAYLVAISAALYTNQDVAEAGNFVLQAAVSSATLSYLLITTSYIILKVKQPHLNRPYKAPLVIPFLTVGLGGLVTISIFAKAEWRALVGIAVTLAVGVCYYVLFGYRGIRDEQYDDDSVAVDCDATPTNSTATGSCSNTRNMSIDSRILDW